MDPAPSVTSFGGAFPWLSHKVDLLAIFHPEGLPVEVDRAYTVESKVNLLCRATHTPADVLAFRHEGYCDEVFVVDDPQRAVNEIWHR